MSAVGEAPVAAGVHQEPAPASLVVIVSPCRAEQARVLATLPPDVAVLLAPSAERAEELLHALPRPRPVPALASAHTPPRPARTLAPAPTGPDHAPAYTLRADERTVVFGDRFVRLTPLEFAMLRALASEPGRVWSFADLSRTVWSTGYVGDGAQVRAVVKRLRRKLALVDAPVAVETVRAAGLRLARRPAPPVQVAPVVPQLSR